MGLFIFICFSQVHTPMCGRLMIAKNLDLMQGTNEKNNVIDLSKIRI